MKKPILPKLASVLIILVFLISFLPADLHAQSWYNTNWSYRKAITIDYTKVGAGPHTNFSVLISMTDANLQSGAQADADDILFTSSDGTTQLAHEIESYTSASGILVAWVKIPTLSSTANTVIYMYYGNAAAASQQNVTGTWDANYRGVYHLNNAFLDATSNAYNGTNTGTTDVTGKISKGRGFVQADGADYVTISGLMGSPANITLSSWANLTTKDVTGAHVIDLGDYVGIDADDVGVGATGFAYFSGGWNHTPSNIHLSLIHI